MWYIQCGICKHEEEAERFFTNEKDRYACPACGVVWRVEYRGMARINYETGFITPPKKICVVEPQMMLVAR